MTQRRRDFLTQLVASAGACSLLTADADGRPGSTSSARDRCAGLLWGTLIGDAMGGPLEFADAAKREGHVVGCRDWPDEKRLDDVAIASIADQATLMSYDKVRPETAPYGPWVSHAPAGTLTDDSRFKIMLIRAIRAAKRVRGEVTRQGFARAIVDFSPRIGESADEATQKLMEEGLREYRYAANWVLGERDPKSARPLERLWAGVDTCAGQMMLLPLAVQDSGRPEEAYQKAFELNFVDSPGAKDIVSALIAGLAAVLGEQAHSRTIRQRWEQLERSMRSTDPFGFQDVPWVGRPLHKWMDLANSIVERAHGRPSVAYRLLETEGKPVYYWDAHFTILVALTLLKLCDYNALAALRLVIDFGHDTDSYASLIGAMAGAVEGTDVFPTDMRQTVAERLEHDYGEDVNDWVSVLRD